MSRFDEILAQMKRPASTSPVHQYSEKDIRISTGAIIELNKRMERSIKEIDRKREVGLSGLVAGRL